MTKHFISGKHWSYHKNGILPSHTSGKAYRQNSNLDGKLTVHGVFLVGCEDRNDGGPISIDVLRYTCLASLHLDIRLLWLDRLCISSYKQGQLKGSRTNDGRSCACMISTKLAVFASSCLPDLGAILRKQRRLNGSNVHGGYGSASSEL